MLFRSTVVTGLPTAGSAGGTSLFWSRLAFLRVSPRAGWGDSDIGVRFPTVSLRRRLGPAVRGPRNSFPGFVFFFAVSVNSGKLPTAAGDAKGNSRIHFTAPRPLSVRIRFLSSRRCKSSITRRFDEPVRLAAYSGHGRTRFWWKLPVRRFRAVIAITPSKERRKPFYEGKNQRRP